MSTTAKSRSLKPRSHIFTKLPLLARSRREMDSPHAPGIVETRMSMSSPPRRMPIRPSIGRRFSAMSRFDMTLMREMMALFRRFSCGGTSTLCSMPSMR